MKTTVTKLLATVAAALTIFGMSTLPAFAAEGKSASNGNSVNISDVNATAETRALFDKLKNSGKGDLRFGQQHATDENISSSASQGDVYEMTGKYPAVFGWDAGLALRGAEKPGSGADKNANAKALAQNITDADSKGAIVTLSAHWCNPGTGKDFNDTTAVASELLPGGKYSGTFNKELDAIAATAQQAKRSDGTLIPIIFRPLHENNGSWFWWGATHASASEYKELYRYIVDYLRDVKDVHNLLYAYSPGGVFNGDSTDYLATYPEIDREEWDLGKQAFHNIREFGCPTWYEWRIQNWGTKWNASGAEVLDGRLSFLTAWNAPKQILEKLSQMFPSITIHHTWADKDIGHNCGERTYQSGVETQEHLPTGQDAIELGCDLWDIDPEEFLCENQDSGMKIT